MIANEEKQLSFSSTDTYTRLINTVLLFLFGCGQQVNSNAFWLAVWLTLQSLDIPFVDNTHDQE